MTGLATDYLILWASQTGNAEWIAKNIHTEASKKGYTGQIFVMDDFENVRLAPDHLRTTKTYPEAFHRHHFKKQALLFWSLPIPVMVMHPIIHSSFGVSCVATKKRVTSPTPNSLCWV